MQVSYHTTCSAVAWANALQCLRRAREAEHLVNRSSQSQVGLRVGVQGRNAVLMGCDWRQASNIFQGTRSAGGL